LFRVIGTSLFLFLYLVSCKSVVGAEWKVHPTVSVDETYQDNVTLASPGKEKPDYITQVSPALSIRAESNHGTLDFNYSLDGLLYKINTEANTINHKLTAKTNIELFSDLLFVDVNGSYGQAIISPEGSVAFDNLTITQNRTDVMTFRINPYVIKHFSENVNVELGMEYGQVNYLGGGVTSENTKTRKIHAEIGNGPSQQRQPQQRQSHQPQPQQRQSHQRQQSTSASPFRWSVTYERKLVNSQEREVARFEEAFIGIDYYFGSQITLLGQIGREDNEFEQTNGSAGGLNAFTWNIGVAWNPSKRTNIEAKVGERFFGTTYSLVVRRTGRRTSAEINYEDEVTSTADAVFEQQIRPTTSDSHASVEGVDVPLPAISSDVYRRKRLTIDLSRAIAKGSIGTKLFGEERYFQAAGETERLYGGEASWAWKLGSRLSPSVFGKWERSNFRNRDGVDDLWQTGVRLVHHIGPRTTAHLEYRHTSRHAATKEDDYNQNAIEIGVEFEL
jgi:hypothetical protein